MGELDVVEKVGKARVAVKKWKRKHSMITSLKLYQSEDCLSTKCSVNLERTCPGLEPYF